jgi:hypothetical protein
MMLCVGCIQIIPSQFRSARVSAPFQLRSSLSLYVMIDRSECGRELEITGKDILTRVLSTMARIAEHLELDNIERGSNVVDVLVS